MALKLDQPQFLLFFLVILGTFNLGSGKLPANDDDDLRDVILTADEVRALEKLKSMVMPFIREDWMKTDFFLSRYVRMANLDPGTAKEMVLQNVRWREQHNISNILSEDWSDMEPDFHMHYYGGRDRKGRPFGTIELGEWDLRGAVLAGRVQRLNRYLMMMLERSVQELLRSQKGVKRPITKGLILIDGEGGNALQHLCAKCLVVLMTWLQNMELYYPRFLKELILINAPPVTAVGLKVMKPIMSAETKAALKIFDGNKKVWNAYLDERIDRSQRTARYGGTRPYEVNQHFHIAEYENDWKPTEAKKPDAGSNQ